MKTKLIGSEHLINIRHLVAAYAADTGKSPGNEADLIRAIRRDNLRDYSHHSVFGGPASEDINPYLWQEDNITWRLRIFGDIELRWRIIDGELCMRAIRAGVYTSEKTAEIHSKMVNDIITQNHFPLLDEELANS